MSDEKPLDIELAPEEKNSILVYQSLISQKKLELESLNFYLNSLGSALVKKYNVDPHEYEIKDGKFVYSSPEDKSKEIITQNN